MRYGNERKFWKSFRIMRVIAWIAVAAAAALCLFVAVKGTGGSKANGTAKQYDPKIPTQTPVNQNLKMADGQMTQTDADTIQSQRAQEEALPGVVIDGKTVIHATAGSTTIKNINLVNSPDNTLYNMTYELRLPDNSAQGYEVLFTTGLITAGNTVLDMELSRPLEAGQYDCILFAQPYYVKDNMPTNNAAMSIVLDVEVP